MQVRVKLVDSRHFNASPRPKLASNPIPNEIAGTQPLPHIHTRSLRAQERESRLSATGEGREHILCIHACSTPAKHTGRRGHTLGKRGHAAAAGR